MAEEKRKNREPLSGQRRMMDTQQSSTAIESALATLQPLRDLSRNWDVDIASWYVYTTLDGVLFPDFIDTHNLHILVVLILL